MTGGQGAGRGGTGPTWGRGLSGNLTLLLAFGFGGLLYRLFGSFGRGLPGGFLRRSLLGSFFGGSLLRSLFHGCFLGGSFFRGSLLGGFFSSFFRSCLFRRRLLGS